MNNNEFEKSFKEIYLAELELKKENTSDNEAIVFYLKIKKKEGELSTVLCDKRDGFNFSTVRLKFFTHHFQICFENL